MHLRLPWRSRDGVFFALLPHRIDDRLHWLEWLERRSSRVSRLSGPEDGWRDVWRVELRPVPRPNRRRRPPVATGGIGVGHGPA